VRATRNPGSSVRSSSRLGAPPRKSISVTTKPDANVMAHVDLDVVDLLDIHLERVSK